MSSTNIDARLRSSLLDFHWELCRRFMARYQHLFREEQKATLAHFFANTQLLICGHGNYTRQLVRDLLLRDQPDVKREISNVEKQIKKEFKQESVPAEMTIKKEVIKDENCYAEKTDFDKKTSEDLTVMKVHDKHKGSANYSEISSNDSLSDVSSDCSLTGPAKAKKPKLDEPSTPESDAAIFAKLTDFRPVKTLRTLRDVYRNLVMFDNDFQKICIEFNRLGTGLLRITGDFRQAHCCGRVYVDQFLLAEAWGTTISRAKSAAKKTFFRKMNLCCYQIVSKKPSHLLENQITRREDPVKNIEYYETIIKKFASESIEQDLIFSNQFTEADRDELKKIARELNLKTCLYGAPTKPQLKIIGRPLPALAIVERIVVHRDSKLCELYTVIPPVRWAVDGARL